ncbi:acyl carrier protein [Aquimarina sp. 2201CG5-10]|uniref:acyl carrier protein n=1 Tax=Aquimarina callyspongiae TaxID=3098150 RepID=UPI002AB4C3E8|nr:acyl carrier protein [Aquimarina sp. 2201CG5-10]MDY8138355.1 acyl carrier protein [Aquimarina sp. 2201CG5-10]
MMTLTIEQNVATITKENIQNWLIEKVAEQLGIKITDISTNEELAAYGLDSMDAVMISGELEEMLDLELPSTILWDYPTIDSISTHLIELTNSEEISLI